MAVILLLAAFSGTVMAVNGQKQVTVSYDNIKVFVDGNLLKSQEEPFTMNGRTYVPLRAVGEALGKKVSWDDQYKAVIIGDRENLGVYLQDLNGAITKNATVKINEKYSMAGQEYTKGATLTTGKTYRDNPDNASSLSFNIPYKYSQVRGLIGLADSNSKFTDPVIVRVMRTTRL